MDLTLKARISIAVAAAVLLGVWGVSSGRAHQKARRVMLSGYAEAITEHKPSGNGGPIQRSSGIWMAIRLPSSSCQTRWRSGPYRVYGYASGGGVTTRGA